MGRQISFRFVSVVIAAVSAANAWAGDLNPPLGQVGATMKPLGDIEPRTAINQLNTPGDADSHYRITAPGSYYLTEPAAPVGVSGIEIASSHVTIDLNGFYIQAVGPSSSGVRVDGPGRSNITVRNGTVAGFSSTGVNLFSGTSCLVEGIHAVGNGGAGISLGAQGTIRSCAAPQNGSEGILMASDGIVDSCLAKGNGTGVFAGGGSLVRACSSQGNGVHGIYAAHGSLVESCLASGNGGHGYLVAGESALRSCTARANVSSGFSTGGQCAITDCVSSQNGVDGFVMISGSIRDSDAIGNAGDGIQVTSLTAVIGNTCHGNGTVDGAGIHVIETGNQIMANRCTLADRGIDVDSGANLIVRNTCAGNVINWDIATGNDVGPIVAPSTNAQPILGNTHAETLTSSDPHTNFTH